MVGGICPRHSPVVGIMSLRVFTRVRNARVDGDRSLHTFAFGTFLLPHLLPETKSSNCQGHDGVRGVCGEDVGSDLGDGERIWGAI